MLSAPSSVLVLASPPSCDCATTVGAVDNTVSVVARMVGTEERIEGAMVATGWLPSPSLLVVGLPAVLLLFSTSSPIVGLCVLRRNGARVGLICFSLSSSDGADTVGSDATGVFSFGKGAKDGEETDCATGSTLGVSVVSSILVIVGISDFLLGALEGKEDGD